MDLELLKNITVCVAIDAKTIEFLRVAWPTWKRFREEMWAMPWLCIWDRDSFTHNEPVTLLHDQMGLRDNVKFVAWPPSIPGLPDPTYADQREKMLTSWVYAPAMHAKTDWWMKIDADAFAIDRSEWLKPEWFNPRATVYNAWIASGWPYTKPRDQMTQLDEWSEKIGHQFRNPPLNLPVDPKSNKCVHTRMASWLSFYRTEWTRHVVEDILVPHVKPLTLPVPSQDGFHWYVSAREGVRTEMFKMKRLGWRNKPGLDGLKRCVEEAMRTQADEKGTNSDEAYLLHHKQVAPELARHADKTGDEVVPQFVQEPPLVIERSMHDETPLKLPPAPTGGTQGVLYMNVGAKHGLNLLVSVMSLRKHYDGPVMIACGDELAKQIGQAIKDDARLGAVELVDFPYERTKRGSIYAVKCGMLDYSPFDQTVFLDCDTLVVGDFSDLFPDPEFVSLTQFANWTTDNPDQPVRERVLGWRDVARDDSALMAGNCYPAINTGVIGFHKEAHRFFQEWRELTHKNICFICDEIAAQLIFYKHPCRVFDERWNCSIVFSQDRHGTLDMRQRLAREKRVPMPSKEPDPRIWHGHGNKFIRRPYGRDLWMPWYERAMADDLARVSQWCDLVPSDRRPETHAKNWDGADGKKTYEPVAI